jgi:aminoglycoside phosphotransferase (APT) family kinase protein
LGMPRPSGFGSHDETIERYTEIIGRPLRDLFFYEVFAGFRFAAIFVRLAALVKGSGILPEESDMAYNNLATQLLAKMLDLPAPG